MISRLLRYNICSETELNSRNPYFMSHFLIIRFVYLSLTYLIDDNIHLFCVIHYLPRTFSYIFYLEVERSFLRHVCAVNFWTVSIIDVILIISNLYCIGQCFVMRFGSVVLLMSSFCMLERKTRR